MSSQSQLDIDWFNPRDIHQSLPSARAMSSCRVPADTTMICGVPEVPLAVSWSAAGLHRARIRSISRIPWLGVGKRMPAVETRS
jgi:hypothetical protein